MDIQYLILLQQLRVMLGGCLDEIFNGISKVAVVVMPLLPAATALGLGLLYSWNEYFADATVVLLFGRNWGNFAAGLLAVLFVTALFPLANRRLCAGKKSVHP